MMIRYGDSISSVVLAPMRRLRLLLAALLLALLASCGGGGGGGQTCDLPSRQAWLRDYFFDWYFWYALSPSPPVGSQPTLDRYFESLLYTGTDPNFPADRWSTFQSTESFNRFFGDGQSLGYGLSVAGLEVAGSPGSPLYVRYIEPLSPAAVAGITRGDRIVSINGRSAADMIANDDFSVLAADFEGQLISLVLVHAGVQRTVNVAARIFALTPLPPATVITSPGGRKMGYLLVKDMISQVGAPLASAMQNFRTQGVTELVIDLRYNGGGLVSVGRDLASYVNATRTAGAAFASLLYNNKQAPANNQSFLFGAPPNALNLNRVYVLQGFRTCSASEQLINALRPFVDVVPIGDVTCGKPVGFLPTDDGCGDTFSVVNFESVNALNEGRYFDGFEPRCAIAEDFTQPLGGPTDPLLNAARNHADGIGCPALATVQVQQQRQQRERALAAKLRRWVGEGGEGERGVMIPR
jgi:carboxyl-terminal processing protease